MDIHKFPFINGDIQQTTDKDLDFPMVIPCNVNRFKNEDRCHNKNLKYPHLDTLCARQIPKQYQRTFFSNDIWALSTDILPEWLYLHTNTWTVFYDRDVICTKMITDLCCWSIPHVIFRICNNGRQWINTKFSLLFQLRSTLGITEEPWHIEAEWRIYASVNQSSLVQIMACRLVGAKPLSERMLVYCLLDPWEQTSVKS